MDNDIFPRNKKIHTKDENEQSAQAFTELKDSAEKIKSAFEDLGLSRQLEANALKSLGESLTGLLNEIRATVNELKPDSFNTFTTGPVHKDITSKSVITRVINKNDFDIHVKVIVNNLSFHGVLPYLCDEFDVSADSTETGSPIGFGDPFITSYSVTFETADKDGNPVTDSVYLYAASRSDYPETPLDNSHLVSSEIFCHTDFICCKNDFPDRSIAADKPENE